MKRYYKSIIICLAVIIMILTVIVIILEKNKQSSSVQSIYNTEASTTPVDIISSSTPSSTIKTKVISTIPSSKVSSIPARPVINFITPVADDLWKINTYNSISWTKAPNVTGYIYLVDATTKNFVGVIIPQTGTLQTSYSWNTRDLLLSRTNPLKKDVTPGSYIVEMAFDANHLPLISSPVFTIVK